MRVKRIWWGETSEEKSQENVSKFHHLYSFKNELKCLRFLLTNYVNIVWPIPPLPFLHSSRLSLSLSAPSHLQSDEKNKYIKKRQQQVKWSERRRASRQAGSGKKKLDGRRKTTIDNSTMDETHPWKSQKWEARQMNFSWASLVAAPLWETVETIFFFAFSLLHGLQESWFLALARFPGFFSFLHLRYRESRKKKNLI